MQKNGDRCLAGNSLLHFLYNSLTIDHGHDFVENPGGSKDEPCVANYSAKWEELAPFLMLKARKPRISGGVTVLEHFREFIFYGRKIDCSTLCTPPSSLFCSNRRFDVETIGLLTYGNSASCFIQAADSASIYCPSGAVLYLNLTIRNVWCKL
jgi:hypothetical protein